MAIDVISNTADYSAKLTANFNYFPINPYATPGLSVPARITICALTQLRTSAVPADAADEANVNISSASARCHFSATRQVKRDDNTVTSPNEIFNLLINCGFSGGIGECGRYAAATGLVIISIAAKCCVQQRYRSSSPSL